MLQTEFLVELVLITLVLLIQNSAFTKVIVMLKLHSFSFQRSSVHETYFLLCVSNF